MQTINGRIGQIKPATWGKRAKRNYTRLALIWLATGAICYWLLATIQPLPANCHTVNGYMPDGSPFVTNQCNK